MKKTIVLICFCLILLCCCSCSQIEDQNGDDNYQLGVISDEDIIKGKGAFSSVGSVKSVINDKLNYRINKFSGVETIYKKTLKGESLTYKVKISVESGNFQACFVNNQKIIKSFTINKEETYTISNIQGELLFVIAGESAKFQLALELVK